MTNSQWVPVVSEKLTQARGLIHIHAYCQNAGCPIREVDIKVKDHDTIFGPMFGRGLTCPVCAQPMTVHNVFTVAEQTAHELREACSIVAYHRVKAREDGLLVNVGEWDKETQRMLSAFKAEP